jgi:hypothetical protein
VKLPQRWVAERSFAWRHDAHPGNLAGGPQRWVAERSFAWLGRDRRQSKDDQWDPESSAAWVRLSAIGGMLRQLAPEEARKPVPFTYEKRKAA